LFVHGAERTVSFLTLLVSMHQFGGDLAYCRLFTSAQMLRMLVGLQPVATSNRISDSSTCSASVITRSGYACLSMWRAASAAASFAARSRCLLPPLLDPLTYSLLRASSHIFLSTLQSCWSASA